MDEMYDDIVSFAELEKFMDQKLKNYSSGMQVRLAFSVATRAEAGVLLIDEVLAVGDSSFQKKCFEYFRSLKRQRKTVVFVSHDMNAVQEYCDRVAVIDKGKVVCLESADVAAKQYNKLFIGDNYHINRSITKRWGNEKIKFSLPSLEISENGKEIVITSEVIVEEDIKDPVYGFMLADSSGRPVMGTNTSIAGAKVDSAKANQNKKLTWRAPNILSSDTYTLELVLMYEDITVVADWWQDAATIEVVNNHSTPYVVSPPVDFKAERL
jgi:ABC-2 type transport system ATP-binding protein